MGNHHCCLDRMRDLKMKYKMDSNVCTHSKYDSFGGRVVATQKMMSCSLAHILLIKIIYFCNFCKNSSLVERTKAPKFGDDVEGRMSQGACTTFAGSSLMATKLKNCRFLSFFS